MKRIKTAAVLLLALAMLCGLAVTAFAADNASLDFSQTGSIGLTLADGDGNAVSGGAVTLYQVATLYLNDGDMAYAYTDAFADCGVALDVENTALAAALAACVTASTPGTEQEIGADGTVSFTGLELGLYLIVQTTDSDNYETINPFVVTVPIDSDGEWVYAVDASPKVGTVTPIEPTPTPT
ncbi:MAG: peptidase, partial [Oscillospiraceae bacterium]|nr:peptidase [Oscillospiraceae bacterium]